MVASLAPSPHCDGGHARTSSRGDAKPEDQNRVLRVLMARMASSMTFGENMIFMLNRAGKGIRWLYAMGLWLTAFPQAGQQKIS